MKETIRIPQEDIVQIVEESAKGRGLWVGLYLPPYPNDPAGRSKHPLVEWLPNDAHLTLLHLGKGRKAFEVINICEALNDALEKWWSGPLSAVLTGVGMFWRADPTLVALVDSAEIIALRTILTNNLNSRMISWSDHFGFIPHITLMKSGNVFDLLNTKCSSTSKYAGKTMANCPNLPVHFPDIRIICGDVKARAV